MSCDKNIIVRKAETIVFDIFGELLMREETQNEKAVKHDIIERQREKIAQQKEQLRKHKEQWRVYNKIVFNLSILIGTLIAIYVGGWLMFVKSIVGTYLAYTTNTLTFSYFVKAVIKCITAATVAGAIWCGGYIVGRKLER